MWKDVRGKPDDITQDCDAGICLVGEEVHVVVSIAEEEVVLQCAVNHSDLVLCQCLFFSTSLGICTHFNDVGIGILGDRNITGT